MTKKLLLTTGLICLAACALRAQQNGRVYILNNGLPIRHKTAAAPGAAGVINNNFVINASHGILFKAFHKFFGGKYARAALANGTGNEILIDFRPGAQIFILGYPAMPAPTTALGTMDYFCYDLTPRPRIGDPDYFISIPFSVTDIGAVTIPFKYRWGRSSIAGAKPKDTNDFSANGNIYFYVGRKYGHTRFFGNKQLTHDSWVVEPALFVGLSSVTLSDTTTVKPASSNVGAFSYGGGIMLSFWGFTGGVFAGRDHPLLSNKARFSPWPWEGRWWLGIGLGIKLSSFGMGGTKQ